MYGIFRLEILTIVVCFPYFLKGTQIKDDYGKWHETLTSFQSHACDDEELVLRCTPNTVISVHYVSYGRQRNAGHLCPGGGALHDKACDSSKAVEMIHERCHKNMMCRLYVSPQTLQDDPCPGVRKFVEVVYRCRPEFFLNKIVCEGNYLHLSCPAGQGLTIMTASYGTTKSGVVECRQSKGVTNEDCLIEHADETIRSICSGRENCSLRADDRTFGNPACGGTKYLKVTYNCVEKRLILPMSRPTEETATSYPAWARDTSAHKKTGPRVSATAPSSWGPHVEMQSDAVPLHNNYHRTSKKDQQDQLVGFMSKWMSAHSYMRGNKEKLILYVSISLAVGFMAFMTVLLGRFVITRLEIRRTSKASIVQDSEDPFFSDSDLEQFDPPEISAPAIAPPPLPVVSYTSSMRRKDSDVLPRAPVNTGDELNHYFS